MRPANPFDEWNVMATVTASVMKSLRTVLISVLLPFGAALALSAADASATAGVKTAEPAPESENGYLKLGFDRLTSFVFVAPAFDGAANGKLPAQTGEEQIPATVKSWSGKKVVITGFMVPVKMEKGLATEFLVMRNTVSPSDGATTTSTLSIALAIWRMSNVRARQAWAAQC